ncbi:MAG: hypothetical protein AAGF01_17475 [Cyanobacteria bacterium P01_G01_bin.38]
MADSAKAGSKDIIAMRLYRLKQRVAEYQASTDERLDNNINQMAELTRTIATQGTTLTASIERLERSIDRLIVGIESQRRTMEMQQRNAERFLAVIAKQNEIVRCALEIANKHSK